MDVITAQEDESGLLKDPELLDRATNLQRILFSQDADLLREANRQQQAGEHFVGVVYAHQLNITIAECISDLELFSKSSNLEDCMNHVTFLPL